MSAIDAGNHVHVAYFCGIPVYWCIEEQDKENVTNLVSDNGTVLTQNDIVIGGGSGEHPALVFNIDYCLWNFSRHFFLDNKIFVSTKPKAQDILNLNSWDFETCREVHNTLSDLVKINDFRFTLIDAVASFIIFEMPLQCIKDPTLRDFAVKLRDDGWQSAKLAESFIGFNGVLQSKKFGRTTAGGKVLWGYSLSDWMFEESIKGLPELK